MGLSWWSLGLTIFTSLPIGRLVRVNEFVPEVAISAMLVLGVSQVADTAWDRVWETLMAARMCTMPRGMGEEVVGNNPVPRAAARLHEARRLDHDLVEVDASLRQAEESLTLNPRVRQGLLHRVVLRTARLGEELDRRSAQAHARHPITRALLRRLGRQPPEPPRSERHPGPGACPAARDAEVAGRWFAGGRGPQRPRSGDERFGRTRRPGSADA